MSPSVCAVVVTYNRNELLLRALEALKNATRPPDQVLIIDNASTDGTEAALKARGLLADPLFEFIALKENVGGAGGFSYGIQRAYERGFDYIYLMDDDGYPAPDNLSALLANRAPNTCLGSLIVDAEHPESLCFPLRLPQRMAVARTLADLKKLGVGETVDDLIIPFNGVLLARALVAQVGIPEASYFIWGDDMEYIWRLQRHGVKLKTIVAARFYHPREKALGTPLFFGRLSFNDTPSSLKLYCMCRNNTVNLLTYRSKLAALAFAFKVVWFYGVTALNWGKLKIGLRGLYHGWRRDFTHHRDYL